MEAQDAQDAQELTIVGADGTPHIFPAGVDPEKAAAVVREHDDFEKRGPRVRSRTGQMYRPPSMDQDGTKEFIQGGIDAVKSTIDPRTYINMAKDVWNQPVSETAMDVVKMPFKIAGGLITDPAYTLGATTAGSIASHAIPASLPKAAKLAGTVAEQVADKGGWPIRMVGSHMLGAGNPAGVAMMAVPDALKAVGGKLKAMDGGVSAAAAAKEADILLQRGGGTTNVAPSIRVSPPKDYYDVAKANAAEAAQNRAAISDRGPGGLLERVRTKEDVLADRAARPSLRERFPNGLPINGPEPMAPVPSHAPTVDTSTMGKAAQDLALGKRPAPPVGPASTLQDLGRKVGTGIDFDQEVLKQQMQTENAARLANRNTKVPVAEGIPPSKSKSAMSKTPGLTRNDLTEVGLNPDLNYKDLTPDLLEKIRTNRASRHATNYGNAQADKAVRQMQDAVPMTHMGAFEQALLERLR
jgi:hypothetical protein